MTGTMTHLFERWNAYEPNRCRFVPFAAMVKLGGIEREIAHSVTLLPVEHALLLAAVIEAIEARDAKAVKHNTDEDQEHDLHEWRYSLGGHSEGTWAEVWFGWPLTVGRSYRAESQQPAEALLAAYLHAVAALEAEADQ